MATTKELLLHWFRCYGKEIATENEMELFKKVMDKYGEDKILEFAVYSYVCDDGSPTILLLGIRNNVVDQILAMLPNIDEMDKKEKAIHFMYKKEFIKELTRTYNQ